jgi:hypothetical protein
MLLRDLANYGPVDDAPSAVVRTFLAHLAGVAIAIAAAIYTCPVPRTGPPLEINHAWILAAVYVTLPIASGVAAMAVFTFGAPRGRQVLAFATMCAWLGPVISFHAGGSSWWFLVTAMLLATSATAMLHRSYQALGGGPPPPPTPATSHLAILVPAAASLQLSAISFAVGNHQAATALAAFSFAATVWLYRNGHETIQPYRFRRTLGAWASAVILTFASLTPYLAAPASDPPDSANNEHTQPYPVLQSIFGNGSDTEPRTVTNTKARGGPIIPGETYPGMILRPKQMEFIRLTAPPPARSRLPNTTKRKPAPRKTSPMTIPFYGAYWFFRATDKTLPPNALESRGDPAAISFRTTDFTPIAMEARQNFGSLLDLACCREIEVVISNGDRRPNTVSVELVLVNSRIAGRPQQSLGSVPVNKTQRWHPGDNREPVAEVLTYRIPPVPAIRQFDEAVLRFELRLPRRNWSAKIAIDRFRLIP